MKKFLTLIILFHIVYTVNAQVSFGPKAGLNVALTSSNNPNIRLDPITVLFNGGAFVNDKFAQQFAGQVELFYSGEGAKYKNKGNATVFTNSLGYLNIPLLFQFVSKGGFFVQTGPQLGFLLSATASGGGNSEDIKSEVNSTKFSWCFGIGQEIAHKLGVDLRYAAGLSKINSTSTYTDNSSVLSIGLFYALHAKGNTSTK